MTDFWNGAFRMVFAQQKKHNGWSPSLSRSLSHTHTHSKALIHSLILTLNQLHSHIHAHTLCLSLLSYPHSCIHTHSLSLSLASFSSLSLNHFVFVREKILTTNTFWDPMLRQFYFTKHLQKFFWIEWRLLLASKSFCIINIKTVLKEGSVFTMARLRYVFNKYLRSWPTWSPFWCLKLGG